MPPIKSPTTPAQPLLAILATATAPLLACTSVLAIEPDTQVRYLCRGEFDAVEVRALFFNTPPAEVVLVYGEGGAERMLQQRAASGARYTDGDQVFWIKGETATWQRGRTMQCKVMEPKR